MGWNQILCAWGPKELRITANCDSADLRLEWNHLSPNTHPQTASRSHAGAAQKCCRKWRFHKPPYTPKPPRRINSNITEGNAVKEGRKGLSQCVETVCSFLSPCGWSSSAGVPWSAGCAWLWAPGGVQKGKSDYLLHILSHRELPDVGGLPQQCLIAIWGCKEDDLLHSNSWFEYCWYRLREEVTAQFICSSFTGSSQHSWTEQFWHLSLHFKLLFSKQLRINSHDS